MRKTTIDSGRFAGNTDIFSIQDSELRMEASSWSCARFASRLWVPLSTLRQLLHQQSHLDELGEDPEFRSE